METTGTGYHREITRGDDTRTQETFPSPVALHMTPRPSCAQQLMEVPVVSSGAPALDIGKLLR